MNCKLVSTCSTFLQSLPFSPGLTVENVKFYNFNRGGRTFEVTSIDGTCVELCGGFHYRMKGPLPLHLN